MLYASALTKVVKEASLTDFQIRYSGSEGVVIPLDKADWQEDDYNDYRGQFEVKVWIKDLLETRKTIIWAAKSAPIKGDIHYRADNKDKKFAFDSHYVLVKIKKERKTRDVKRTNVPVLNEKGEPVLDEDGKPKLEDRTETEEYVDEVAYLKYLPNDKIEEFSLKAGEGREDLLKYLNELKRLQDLEKKKPKGKIKPKPSGPRIPMPSRRKPGAMRNPGMPMGN
jgi:hypothetical protein